MRSTIGRWLARVGGALLIGGLVVTAAPTGAVAAVDDAAAFESVVGDDGPGALIVGGRNATQTYSFMVSLQNGGRHFCGGSLISANWVITAKHCVASSSNFQMRIGTTNRTTGGTVVNSAQVIRHPSADLALVRTSAAVTGHAPVTIAPSTAVGQATRIIGWGQSCPTRGCGQVPTVLQELDTTLVADSRCLGIRGATEICVGNVGGTNGACYGDSGGPSVTPGATSGSWLLTGATSRSGGGARCGVTPSIYVDVTSSSLRSWIRTNSGV